MPIDDATTEPSPDLCDELLALATAIAGHVATHLAEVRSSRVLTTATKSTATDMVTDMDLWSEREIVGRLRAARPHDAIVGEEGTAHDGGSGVRWIVDPVDGTTNYLYGHPGYSVSIGAEIDGRLAVGVVADPTLDDLFAARAGGGATRNGRPIAASPQQELSLALVGTGFGYRPERRAAQGAALARVLPRVRDIRRMGGAALDLCSVACGRLDAFYEYGLAPWDVAAGAVIATEAGALVTDLAGRPTLGPMVVAAPRALHGPLCTLLREVGADDLP